MPDLYIGLMSGTSIDSVDAALIEIGDGIRLVSHCRHPIPEAVHDGLIDLISDPDNAGIRCVGQLDRQLGEMFAEAALTLLKQNSLSASRIRAIGSHGQTLWHEPGGDPAFTWQIGDPNVIAARTGITTVADFRRRDIANGGQGAPLAPAFHRAAFASESTARVIVNIGGFANLTLLQPGQATTGFDSGPGNVLMDGWCRRHLGSRYDEGGHWAKSGSSASALLDALLEHPYFALPPPKSTGREMFNLAWLDAIVAALDRSPEPVDVQATLCELTAVTITRAILQYAPGVNQVFICGGGHRNSMLINEIARRLPDAVIATTESLGIHPDWVEAAAFAWLAQETLAGRAINISAITGSGRPDVLGAVFPVQSARP